MRTRFLAVDYFTSRIPDFLRLPIPRFLSPPAFSKNIDLLLLLRHCFGYQIGISLQLESFPISDALLSFFADVVPHAIELENDEFATDHFRRNDSASVDFRFLEDFDEGHCGVHITPIPKTVGDEVADEEKRKVGALKYENGTTMAEFEVPRPNQLLEDGNAFEREQTLISLKVFECDESNMETIQTVLASLPLHGVKSSLFSVENLHSEFDMDLEVIPEDNDLSLGNGHLGGHAFPLFELEELDIEKFSILSMEDELLLFLECVEPVHGVKIKDTELYCLGLLGFKENDIVDKTSHLILEADLSCVPGTSYTEDIEFFYSGLSDADCAFQAELVPFEVFKMLDTECFEMSKAIYSLQIPREPEKVDLLIPESMNFKSFDDLIVFQELDPVDEVFKSLPAPLLDDKKVQSPHTSISTLLARLEAAPTSASDEIYLDWDLLGIEKYRCDVQATCQKMFSDIQHQSIPCDQQFAEGFPSLLNLVSSGETLNEKTCTESKLNTFSDDSCILVDQHSLGIFMGKMIDDANICEQDGKTVTHHSENSLAPEQVRGFNSLKFFTDLSQAKGGTKSDLGAEMSDAKSFPYDGLSENRIELSSSTCILRPKWDIKIHQINLPENILTLVESFVENYFDIVNGLHLRGTDLSVPVSDRISWLRYSEDKLREYMKRSIEDKSSIGHGNEDAVDYVALGVIKRMAWYLCFYGIRTLHCFVENLFGGFTCLKQRLGNLQSCIEDAFQLANEEVTKFHPSLVLIQELLSQDTNEERRVLILADQELWWPLKRLLASLKISVTETQYLPDASNPESSFDTKRSNFLQLGCLLMDPENISSSLLANEFDVVLEYGAQDGSSKVSTILTKEVSSLNLHFLKLELNGAAASLCSGVDGLSCDKFTLKLKELLCFGPMVEKYNLLSIEAEGDLPNCIPKPVHFVPTDHQLTQTSFVDKIVIVNTQDFDTEMIISRRTTYQRILAMEKGGAQVLERDFSLPVDLIISASMCLTWYDCKNIVKKTTAADEASSCFVPLCIENIAANVLTSLSFAFSRCILIFEGESSFQSSIMESSHELYAAAASLGIDLQIFYSYSSDLTEEIVLDCISYALRTCEGLFLKFPESETISESFLTKFPSLNPLSALSILSAGKMLIDFFSLSEDCKLRSLKKFNVTDESIILFEFSCRYGQKEDSISVMTDCSSSVSSAPKSQGSTSMMKGSKRKFVGSPYRGREGFGKHQPVYYNHDNLYTLKMSGIPRAWEKSQLPDQSFVDEPIFYGQRPDRPMRIDSASISKPNSAWYNGQLSHKQKYGLKAKINPRSDGDNMFQVPKEDLLGEVVDDFLLAGDFSSSRRAMEFSPPRCEKDKVAGLQCSAAARNLLSDQVSSSNFPMTAEVGSDNLLWDPVDGNGQLGPDNDFQHVYYKVGEIGQKHQIGPLQEDKIDQSTANLHKLFNNAKGLSSYGGTPLKNAIFSSATQQASPWTIKFLNRVREKTRLRKHSLPNDPSGCPRYPGSTSKATKRKSPSVLEYFKYQGGSTPTKLTVLKRQKQMLQASNLSRDKNISVPTLRSWTPVDKRAKQILSFATKGNEGQTKLIWSDRT